MYYFASLSDSNALLAHTGLLFKPLGLNVDAYKAVINNPNIVTSLCVTLFVVIVGTFLNVFVTAISAFVLTRRATARLIKCS